MIFRYEKRCERQKNDSFAPSAIEQLKKHQNVKLINLGMWQVPQKERQRNDTIGVSNNGETTA